MSALQEWWRSHDSFADGPVVPGSHPDGASPYGVMDMAGNVWEWCADWYDKRAYLRYASGDLTAPRVGHARVCRGGAWWDGDPDSFRCSRRWYSDPSIGYPGHGFRYVRDGTPEGGATGDTG